MAKLHTLLKWRNLLAILAGGLLPFAFAPYNYWLLAFIAPAILFWLWAQATPKQAAWQGFYFGIGCFSVGVSWVYISIYTFGQTNFLIAGFITTLFCGVLALFPAIQGYLLRRYFSRCGVLSFASSWVLLEALRCWIFSGFPWLLLAHSQISSPLSVYIPVLGTFATGFLVALCAACVVQLLTLCYRSRIISWISTDELPFVLANRLNYPNWQRWLRQGLAIITLVIIFAYSTVLQKHNWIMPVGNPLKISLVQGNIPQELKWDPHVFNHTKHIYQQLTQQHWDSQIIIWPEAAIPALLNDERNYFKALDELAKAHNVALLAGVPLQLTEQNYYNAVIALGNAKGSYFKRHLVPFGEYVPIAFVLRGLIGFFDLPMSNFSAGSLVQPTIVAAGVPFATFICYEIAYPNLVRSNLPAAQALITVSNDAWFGDSLAPWQHLQISQFQALQSGRPLLFVSNTGVSAFINAQGQLQATIPQFKQGVLTANMQPMQGITPWVRLGDTPWLILFALLLSSVNLLVSLVFLSQPMRVGMHAPEWEHPEVTQVNDEITESERE